MTAAASIPCTSSLAPTTEMKGRSQSSHVTSQRRWRNLRIHKLLADPWCESHIICGNAGRLYKRLATEVDHKQPVAQYPHLVFDWTNLMSVCGPCHEEIARLAKAYPGAMSISRFPGPEAAARETFVSAKFV